MIEVGDSLEVLEIRNMLVDMIRPLLKRIQSRLGMLPNDK